MRCVRPTLMVSFVLLVGTFVGCALAGCAVDRMPLAAEQELVSDSGHSDAVFQWQDARQADDDAALRADARVDVDSSDVTGLPDATTDDASLTDAGDPITDAGHDAQEPVDAYVPPPRYVGPCKTDHDCELDEICVRSEGLLIAHSYCAQRCTGDFQCNAGPTGSDPPRCTSSGRCRLPCDAVIGAGCPSTMTCQDLLLLLPVDDGTCTFQE